MRSGDHLYVFVTSESFCVKVGSSGDPHRRISQAQVGNHERLVLYAVIRDAGAVERDIHHYLRRYRKHGEWFSPSCLLSVAAAVDRVAGGLSVEDAGLTNKQAWLARKIACTIEDCLRRVVAGRINSGSCGGGA